MKKDCVEINKFYVSGCDNQYPRFLFFDYEKYAKEVLKKNLCTICSFSKDYYNQKVYSYLTEKDLPYKDVCLAEVLNNLKPKNIEDLSVALALSSPYKINIAKEISSNKIIYTMPSDISQIIQNTYNRIIYREQVVNVLSKIMNCTVKEANIYRKELIINKEKILNLMFDKCVKLKFDNAEQFIRDNFINYSDYFVKETASKYANIIYNLVEAEYNS